MTADEDALDVRKVLDGDVDAFEGVVRRWQAPLVNLAFRFCRDRDEAEELAQEAFVKAYRSLRRWRGESRFSTWLFAVALNHYRSRLRRARYPHVALEAAGPIVNGRAVDRELEESERARAVRDAVSTLPQKYREAIVLFYMQELDVQEASQSLGVPEGTFKARLHRARELLRVKITEQWAGAISGGES